MAFLRASQVLLVTAVTILATCSAYAAGPRRRPMPVPSVALVPPAAPKQFRRGVKASASLFSPTFLPTPLPPLDSVYPPVRGHRLTQPKKPVYHYTPIKPFSIEDLGNTYKGRGKASTSKGLGSDRQNYGIDTLFSPAAGGIQRDSSYGPQVYEATIEEPLPPRPILPPTPIRPDPTVRESGAAQLQVTLPVQSGYSGGLIPETELDDIKNIRLGEAFGGVQTSSGVVQRQNPAHSKYHFEYQVRDHEGEFGHAEAKDGPVTSGGYDVNLRKTHVQSVRYFVDSKEIPRYGYAYL